VKYNKKEFFKEKFEKQKINIGFTKNHDDYKKIKQNTK